MADAFPNSHFVGFDYHEPSIERARELAAGSGVGDNTSFAVASAKDYPGSGYDLVCVFACLHDMGDPVGAAAHMHETLAADGTWMIVEPFANDSVAENLNPVGRVFYGASTVICTPASLAQEVGLALGAQAGEARLAEVIKEGGLLERAPRDGDAVALDPGGEALANETQGGVGMPKVSKQSARGGGEYGPVTDRSDEFSGYSVNFTTFHVDMDQRPMLKGLPNDECQCPHWGYVTKGSFTFRCGDREEVFNAGDAFYLPPGHAGVGNEPDSEMVQFSPTVALKETEEVITKNLQSQHGG